MKSPAVYIVTNKVNGTLYIGVTSDLIKRIYEHKHHLVAGFTKKYNCTVLVYYEAHATMEYAIMREKQLKNFSRMTKIKIIENYNPAWEDLYESFF